ncbi:hypothetical protein GGQ87_001491 [Brevundimonas alba]|uniref:TonB C-terminal domain-containing protein n=1 Tax=Brevundimonas alba TaxID=74314 RepID=A0A7X5YK49_9CAUL|nr:hypothetical protein [Brevundimonas alba]NJC41233.1 hypothetical protein [Brevundimonas alba]
MKRALVLLTASAVALPALAQDTSGDWDISRDPAKRMVLAYTTFDNGLSVGFRCIDGSFNAVIAGLPPSRDERRTLDLAFRDDEAHPTMWTSTTDSSVVVSDFPAPLAREFRQGGALKLTVPRGAADGRNLRYDVELPTSSAAVDEALTACGRPLVDPRDAELEAIGETGLTGELVWDRAPRPRYPSSRYASGFVVTTCMTTPQGALRDCVVEMEHPHDGRFGRAALEGAEHARVRNPNEGQPVPVVRMSFRTIFRMR